MFKLNRFVGSVAAVAASAVLVAAVPAQASSTSNDPNPGAPAAAPQEGSTSVKPREKLYCFVDTFTGSRVAKKVCKTKSEWTREGMEIYAK